MPLDTARIRRALVSNWSLKLLALLLAGLTFQTIRAAISFEVVYEVPIEFEAEKGIAVLEQDARIAEVTFQGSREDVRRLDQQLIKAVVRPKATDPKGSEIVQITDRNIEGIKGTGVRVVKVWPSLVRLTFDREDQKTVAVLKPRTVGKPLVGKAEVNFEPAFVTLRGPRRRLQDKTFVVTEPVDVDGRVESFAKRVKLLSPGDSWVSEIDPAEVTVNVTIVTESAEREWTNAPVLSVTRPGTEAVVRFEPPEVHVRLHGRTEQMEGVTWDSARVFVDCTDIEATGTYELPVKVYLPPATDLNVSTDPETVKVHFRKP